MRSLIKPKAVLFDWDNTLVDTWPVIHKALNMTMRFMNHEEWSLDYVKATVKKSMRDSFPELFGDDWKRAADHYQQSYRSIHLQELGVLEGAEDVLKALKNTDWFIGIVSNKKGPSLRRELEHLGWGHYFQAAIGSEDSEYDKPHPAPVLEALKSTAIMAGAHIWFVGDTAVDLECAQVTRSTPILYGDVQTNGGTYEGFPFDAHVKNHAEMLELVKKFAS
ncbi:MAG: HAD-IA family hydrolase [Alphaproteobacteria bacterium]|nr:HAD-IA family hydrolase [Alphaproteobacteria bacterium]